MAGLLLGFFGLPTVIDSPTAQTVTATVTATVTVTAPAPMPTGSPDEASVNPSSPAPLPTGEVPLTDLSPVRGSGLFDLRSVSIGSKPYEQAMTLTYPCNTTAGIQYSINERYKSLTLIVGLDDRSTAELIKVTIEGDGRALKTVGAEINRPQNVTVDMASVRKLAIKSFGECGDSDKILLALADATLHS
ncbi:hypothetical protein [Streptomyces tagetis]|uniref:Glycosyl hydrolase family 98 putative carbohydrate-binding module domain-containing protein n=1 Tax=Streptomyces tagetis TaxID=2820809 RepID=A0A940XKU4_9ACTN|nr:hypothetical protein [Streptomyces sp. RG38]MBQ0830224.1 hypothetical protein [Streptomyces sp. RG38]